ncbi:MAG TPA: hypothetical protein VFZ66_08030 [Herpetosiphonaceae bacterium]
MVQPIRLLAALIITQLLLSALPGALHPRTTPQPQDQATRPQATAASLTHKIHLPLTINLYDPTYVNPFGIVMYGNVDQANGLAQMRAAGARRVTTVIDWGTIEPAEGVRDWSSFDTKVRNAQDAGMSVFALFTGDPAWAWTPDRSATQPDKRLNFVRAMIRRYDCDGSDDAPGGLCVHDWSFYAEPDFYVNYYQDDPGIKGYWGKRGAEYAHMLADVANVVHGEDRGARVMIGGLAYDAFLPPGGTRGFVREFLPIVLATLNSRPGGATAYLDAVAVHYYSIIFPSIRDKVFEIRNIMQYYGVGHLPVIVPEAGYWSAPESGSSENQQAQRLVHMYVEALAVGVEHLAWFTVFDSGGGGDSSGLFRGRDLNSPKPAYNAYYALTRELSGAKYTRLLNQPGVAGYVFRTPRGTEKTVAWSANGYATFAARCLRLVNKTGVAFAPIADGNSTWDKDGAVNGQIRLQLSANEPWYIEACQ